MPVFANTGTDDQFVWDRCASFEGGMVSFAKAGGLPQNQSALLYDAEIHITGQVRKRRGVSDIKTPIGPIVTGKTIQGLKWFDTPTLDRLLAVVNGKFYQYDQPTHTWSVLIDDAVNTDEEQISIAQLSDTLFWTDSSVDGIVTWDRFGDGLAYIVRS